MNSIPKWQNSNNCNCNRCDNSNNFKRCKCFRCDDCDRCHHSNCCKCDDCDRCHHSNCCKCDDCDRCHHSNCCKCDDRDKCNEDENMFIHVHEFESSVKLAEEGDDRHNHRVAGVTGPAIPISGGSHVHEINNQNIDFFDHFHKICVTTGPAIPIPGAPDKHVHLVAGNTTIVDEHFHAFLFTTLINSPLLPAAD